MAILLRLLLFGSSLMPLTSLATMPSPPALRFFNSGTCPFAQRAWIALEESDGADYTTTLVDLQDKSPEFVELYAKANPVPGARAKVPLLQVGDDTFLCESAVVAEYIAEAYPSSLLPARPDQRATMRLFIELCGQTFPYFPLLRAQEGDEFEAALREFREGLVNADAFLRRSHATGPFVLGEEFTLAECTTAPFVQRCCAILPQFTGKNGNDRIDPLEICDDLKLDRLRQWIEAVCARPSVAATGVPVNDMIESTSRMLERFAAMEK